MGLEPSGELAVFVPHRLEGIPGEEDPPAIEHGDVFHGPVLDHFAVKNADFSYVQLTVVPSTVL